MKTVIVEVRGGRADLTHATREVQVHIVDWDNSQAGACPWCDEPMSEEHMHSGCAREYQKTIIAIRTENEAPNRLEDQAAAFAIEWVRFCNRHDIPVRARNAITYAYLVRTTKYMHDERIEVEPYSRLTELFGHTPILEELCTSYKLRIIRGVGETYATTIEDAWNAEQEALDTKEGL